MSSRGAPLAGVAGVLGIVVAFMIGGSTPDTQGSDAKITAYFTSSSHQTQQIAALLIFVVAMMLLIAFFAVLRERTGGSVLIVSAGTASIVLMFLAAASFAGPSLAASDTSRFHLDPNTYRLIN